MSISIKSNIAAMNAQRRLGGSTAELSQSFTRLSSGLRINRAADDAAGLAIASGLNADVRTYTQGIRNINDGLSVLDVAEAALGELSNIVNRQMKLAQQSANGVLTYNQRRALDTEADALTEEYNRIVRSTNFNGFQLLDLSNPSFRIQAGYGLNEAITLALGDALGRDVGDGTYTSSQNLGGGSSRARDAVTADLDGDGHLDIITVSDLFSTLSVELGRGDGTFKGAVNYTTPGAGTGVKIADLNGDGKLDAVFTGGSYYSIFLGNGNGTLLASTSYSIGATSPVGTNLVDMNNDGRLDLVIGNTGTGTVGVYLGCADGTFGAQQSFSIGLPALFDIALGDINNDGIIDVAATNSATNTVNIMLGTGGGSFGAVRSYSTNSGANSLTLGDLNNDGRLDLVVSTSGTDRFEIRLGNGDGTFKAAISSNDNVDGSNHIHVADLNGDGILDVIHPDGGGGSSPVLFGNGNGTFNATTSLGGMSSPNVAVVGDYNEDGVPDVVVMAHNGTPGVAFMSGVTQTTLMPILNISTQADARDTLTFLQEQLDRISLERGNIGSMQSRLGFAANVLEQRRQNYAAASSSITDVDVATEAAQLVRSKILQQAGAAVLAQANQAPAMALILLDGGKRR